MNPIYWLVVWDDLRNEMFRYCVYMGRRVVFPVLFSLGLVRFGMFLFDQGYSWLCAVVCAVILGAVIAAEED